MNNQTKTIGWAMPHTIDGPICFWRIWRIRTIFHKHLYMRTRIEKECEKGPNPPNPPNHQPYKSRPGRKNVGLAVVLFCPGENFPGVGGWALFRRLGLRGSRSGGGGVRGIEGRGPGSGFRNVRAGLGHGVEVSPVGNLSGIRPGPFPPGARVLPGTFPIGGPQRPDSWQKFGLKTGRKNGTT